MTTMRTTGRLVLVAMVVFALYYAYIYLRDRGYHFDFARVHRVAHMAVYAPVTPDELAGFLRRNTVPLAIRGAGFSHGGQVLVEGGIQLDLGRLSDKVIRYDPRRRCVTVGAGCRWYDVLIVLARRGRTVAEMQSYYNFTVGGSLSVNCHGRGTVHGAISDTVVALRVLTARGEFLWCGPDDRTDLFRAVVGGYGLVAVVCEAVLRTVPNDRLRLRVTTEAVSTARSLVDRVSRDPAVALWNANVYPSDLRCVRSFEWVTTDAAVTHGGTVWPARRTYVRRVIGEQLLRRVPGLVGALRAWAEPALAPTTDVFWRSYVLAEDARSLAVLARQPTTTVLQEYFAPVERTDAMLAVLLPRTAHLNCLNISIRFVRAVRSALLSYAPTDSVSVVLYVNVFNNQRGLRELHDWTRASIDAVVRLGGRFYLPYLRTYDPVDVRRAYPEWAEFTATKRRYDPDATLQNEMYRYISGDS